MVDFLTKCLVKDDTRIWSRNTPGLGSVFAKGHADGSSQLTFLLTITGFLVSLSSTVLLLRFSLHTAPLALCGAPKCHAFTCYLWPFVQGMQRGLK